MKYEKFEYMCQRCFQNTHFVQMDDDGNNDWLSESELVEAAIVTNYSDAKVYQKSLNLKSFLILRHIISYKFKPYLVIENSSVKIYFKNKYLL